MTKEGDDRTGACATSFLVSGARKRTEGAGRSFARGDLEGSVFLLRIDRFPRTLPAAKLTHPLALRALSWFFSYFRAPAMRSLAAAYTQPPAAKQLPNETLQFLSLARLSVGNNTLAALYACSGVPAIRLRSPSRDSLRLTAGGRAVVIRPTF